MRNFFQIRNKFKICCVLIVIIVMVLLNNLRSRRNIASLDKSVSSIYQDRLLPATYLHGISAELYSKRLMLEERSGLPEGWRKSKNDADKNIDSFIRSFDSTYLTSEEKTRWMQFKQQLQTYSVLENAGFATVADGKELTKEEENKLDIEFHGSLALLNALARIQAGEGKILQTGSHDIASGSVLGSHLEMALLIILALMALVLLSMTDRHVLNPDEKIRMN